MRGFTDERGTSSQHGIVSRHCFSSGPYYDPERISYGPIVGVDEHLVEPGAGFDWHAHRGVHIASWVLEGALRHEDSRGEVRFVGPGTLLVQNTGDGIRHAETNASDADTLRFLQITVLGDGPAGVRTSALPAQVGDITVDVRESFPDDGSFVLVIRGRYQLEGTEPAEPGSTFLGWTGQVFDPVEPGSQVLVLSKA